MADDLFLLQYGAWDDPNWEDTTPPPPGSLVAADYGGGLNDLNIGTGIGGVMTGDGAADTLQVAEPYPGFGTIEFDGTVSADFFELSASSTMDTGPGLIIDGGDLVTSGTLIVGAGATLEVSGGGAIDSSGTVQVFGAIDVNGGSITADQLYIQGTLDLISGSGTIATLVVGSFTGTGGLGGIGELEIAAGNTITVSVGLAVANEQGTGIVAINGGVLIVNGAADVGEAGEAKNPGIGSLTITAGGSMSVSDTLDIGVSADGIGTVAVSGDDFYSITGWPGGRRRQYRHADNGLGRPGDDVRRCGDRRHFGRDRPGHGERRRHAAARRRRADRGRRRVRRNRHQPGLSRGLRRHHHPGRIRQRVRHAHPGEFIARP